MASIEPADILDQALALLDSDGLDAVSLAAIARRLDVTQPALYHHVDGIDAVWRSIGLRVREDLAETLTSSSIGRAGASAVRGVAEAWRSFGIDQPNRYRSTERYPVAGDPELEAAVDRVIDVLIAALRGFDMTEAEQVHAARTLRSALHGFVIFELGDGHPLPHQPTATFTHMVELLIVGFEALAEGRVDGV